MRRFLIADLGILRYPQYVVRRTRAVWPDRRSLIAYEAALRHAEALDTALEVLLWLWRVSQFCRSAMSCNLKHEHSSGSLLGPSPSGALCQGLDILAGGRHISSRFSADSSV